MIDNLAVLGFQGVLRSYYAASIAAKCKRPTDQAGQMVGGASR
jgi:hypothetical protein